LPLQTGRRKKGKRERDGVRGETKIKVANFDKIISCLREGKLVNGLHGEWGRKMRDLKGEACERWRSSGGEKGADKKRGKTGVIRVPTTA